MAQRSGDPAGGVLGIPRPVRRADALLQVGDDLAGNRHKLMDECTRVKADAIKAGALQSNRVTAVKAADDLHKDAMTKITAILFLKRATTCSWWRAKRGTITIYERDSVVPIRSEIPNATVRPQHLAASSPFAGK